MNLRSVVLATLVTACGAAQPDSVPARPEASGQHVRDDLVCTEWIPSGETDCVAAGCRWGPPLFCSGDDVPHEQREAFARDSSRACACVCEADRVRCMQQP